MAHSGLAKLTEECGELGQVIGKILQVGYVDAPHWSGDLRVMLQEEMGDVLAAITYVYWALDLDQEAINERKRHKLATYHLWGSNDVTDNS